MIPGETDVYFANAPTDLRKSFDGLAALCAAQLQKDPTKGGLFVFLNKRRTQVKILFRDGQGWCILQKRIDKGKFRGPKIVEGAFAWHTDPKTLMAYLHDIDFTRARKTKTAIKEARLLKIVQEDLQ